MPNPFAAIETSINAACIGALANVTATLASAVTISAILSKPSGGQMGIMSTSPELVAKTSDLATVANGQTITINAVAYTVRAIEPDGTGMTRITLE
jgi:hypothetical protein